MLHRVLPYHVPEKEILGLVHLYPQRKVLAFGSPPQTLKPKMDMTLRFEIYIFVYSLVSYEARKTIMSKHALMLKVESMN